MSRAVPSMKTLLGRLGGVDTHAVLSVTAQLVLLLGSGLQPMWVSFLADHDNPAGPFGDIWERLGAGAPWTEGLLGPLVDWVDHTGDAGAVIKDVAGAYRDVDVHELNSFAGPHGGDFLGPLYCELMSTGGRAAKGAFYTPMGVSTALARMTGPREEGVSILDPCCGSGGMLVAAGQVMREQGLDPTTCLWVGNDIDPVAVALAAVNLTARGMGPNIWLSVGNGLLLGTGRDGDPHLQYPPWWERGNPPELLEQAAADLTAASPPFLSDGGSFMPLGGHRGITLGNRRGLPDTDLAPPGEGGAA